MTHYMGAEYYARLCCECEQVAHKGYETCLRPTCRDEGVPMRVMTAGEEEHHHQQFIARMRRLYPEIAD